MNPNEKARRAAVAGIPPQDMRVQTILHTDHSLGFQDGGEFGPELVVTILVGCTPDGAQLLHTHRFPIPDPATFRLDLARVMGGSLVEPA